MTKKFKVKVSDKEYIVEVEELKKAAKNKAIEVALSENLVVEKANPKVEPEKKSETKPEPEKFDKKAEEKAEEKVEKVEKKVKAEDKAATAEVEKYEAKVEDSIGKIDVIAPLPGVIVDILVKRGDKVKENEAVIVLEAMKMENSLLAPIYGIVEQIHVVKGQTVDGNYPLITIVG